MQNVTLREEHLLFQIYVRAYRKQQCLRENNHKLSREINDLSIPMLIRLKCLRLAVGRDTRLGIPTDNSSHPNQQWYELLYGLNLHVPDRRGTSRRDTDPLLTYRATLAILDLRMVSLADCNTGQSTGSWYQFFRRVPERLLCLLDIRLRDLYYSVPMLGPRRRCYRGKLEPSYLKAVEHAIINAIDIPQTT